MVKIGIKIRVSAIIFDSKGLVLTKHFVKGFGEYFLLPGGGLEKGEDPIEALKRECKEEIGVDIWVERLVYYKSAYSDEDTYLDLIFLCKPLSNNFKVSPEEQNVKGVVFIKNEEELKKINFFPKQIIQRIYQPLPISAEFLGKVKYPEE
ncbi:NUDIX hydrolase [Candidatus Woesearchaeota archaeon]|nr:NUDIX hydrolase [Candidatus Woesearchaeota archaeon]